MIEFATFARRFWGFVLDALFDLTVLGLLGSIGVGEWTYELWGVWLLLHHVGLVMEGGTLGHRVLGMRIVGSDGEPVAPVRAVVRVAIKICSLLPLGLGCLWMLDDPQRRAWHDRGARTLVVRELAPSAISHPEWASNPPWRQSVPPSASKHSVSSSD